MTPEQYATIEKAINDSTRNRKFMKCCSPQFKRILLDPLTPLNLLSMIHNAIDKNEDMWHLKDKITENFAYKVIKRTICFAELEISFENDDKRIKKQYKVKNMMKQLLECAEMYLIDLDCIDNIHPAFYEQIQYEYAYYLDKNCKVKK